jgi:hypothetical protein
MGLPPDYPPYEKPKVLSFPAPSNMPLPDRVDEERFRLLRDGVPSSRLTSDLKQERMRPDPPQGALPNITALPAPVMSDHNGEHWKAPIDLVRELLHDMETGAVDPDCMYVAMRVRHTGDEKLFSFPSYCYSRVNEDGLFMIGLLTRHVQKIGEELQGDAD